MDSTAVHPREEWSRISSELEAQAGRMTQMASNIPCTTEKTTIYVDISATTAIINKRQCTISFFRDVTERKRIEDELLESEGKLQAMFESIADGIIVTDLRGNHSPPERCHGSPLRYAAGRADRQKDSGLRLGERPARVMGSPERAYEEGRSGSIEYLLLTKTDREMHAELSTALLRDKSGKPTGFIAVTKDISERKRAEEEILQRTRELSALHQVLTSITQTLDLDEVLNEIVSHVGAALESNYTSIVMVNEDGSLGMGSEEFADIPPLSGRARAAPPEG